MKPYCYEHDTTGYRDYRRVPVRSVDDLSEADKVEFVCWECGEVHISAVNSKWNAFELAKFQVTANPAMFIGEAFSITHPRCIEPPADGWAAHIYLLTRDRLKSGVICRLVRPSNKSTP